MPKIKFDSGVMIIRSRRVVIQVVDASQQQKNNVR